MNTQIINAIKVIADKELKPRFAKVVRNHKQDGSFITEADLAVQSQIEKLLFSHYPEVSFLGEEMSVKDQQLAMDDPRGVWILDPLDGTSNFAAGIPYYAVSLAYIKSGKPSWGMVYDPERGECFSAIKGKGAMLNDVLLKNLPVNISIDKSTAVIDFKRLRPELASHIAMQPPYSSQRSFGGVALDWCWLAAGRFHLYLHGKQNIWDYAAGHLVFSELASYSCTLQGEQVYSFSLSPRSAVAAANETLFKQWCEFLKINHN